MTETTAQFAEQRGVWMTATPIETTEDGGMQWNVILRGPSSRLPMTVIYTMGAAFRRWKSSGFLPFAGKGSIYFGARRGERVPFGIPRTLHDVEYLQLYSEPMAPELPEVLDSLRTDAEYGSFDFFEDFAAELGYDPDSRKAEAAYLECKKVRADLRRILGAQGFEDLMKTERM